MSTKAIRNAPPPRPRRLPFSFAAGDLSLARDIRIAAGMSRTKPYAWSFVQTASAAVSPSQR